MLTAKIENKVMIVCKLYTIRHELIALNRLNTQNVIKGTLITDMLIDMDNELTQLVD